MKISLERFINILELRISKPIVEYIERRSLFVLSMLILIIGMIVYWDFFTFQKFYFFKDIGSDTLNASYPRFVHISNYLREWGFPKWSFQVGMGQNFLPLNVGDPFNWILYILGAKLILPGIFYVEFLKILVAGILFFLFLRVLNIHRFASVIGGLLYAYCSYLIVGGSWFQTSNETVCAALLLLSLGLFFNRKNWYLVPVAFMAIAIYLTFWLYFYAILTGVYATVYFIISEKKPINKLFISYFKLSYLALFGVLMGSILFFPNIIQYLESPRVGGDASYFNTLSGNFIFRPADISLVLTTIFRFFSNDLQGCGSGFYGWYNYFEAPMYYCGLLSLLLFSQVFSIVSGNKKILFGGFVLFGIIPLIFPYFRHSIWLFTGDYFRTYSFFISIVLLVSSQTVLSNYITNNHINVKHLTITWVILLTILILPRFFHIRLEQNVLFNVRLTLIALFIILLLFSIKKVGNIAKLLLLFITVFEIIVFTGSSIDGRVALSADDVQKRNFYNDVTVDAVQYIQDKDSSFYRIEKNYSSSPAMHASINDALAQNYFGTSSYDSFNQISYIRFLEDVNIIHKGNEKETRWAVGLRNRPLLQSMANVKYFLTYQDTHYLEKHGYSLIGIVGSLKILFNNFYLPLGFTYDHYISYDKFRKIDAKLKDAHLLEAAVIGSQKEMEELNELSLIKSSFNAEGPDYTGADYKSDTSLLKADTLRIHYFSPNQISGSIDLQKPKILFFSIPYDAGWTATDNGMKTALHLVNIGFTGLFLKAGHHNIVLTFEPRFLRVGTFLTIIFILLYILLIFLKKNRRFSLPGKRI